MYCNSRRVIEHFGCWDWRNVTEMSRSSFSCCVIMAKVSEFLHSLFS